MRNIVLFCSAGMSTSLLVTKMRKYAEEIGYEADINAYSLTEVDSVAPTADIILLGPQVRFNLESLQKQFPDKKVAVIEMRDYGMMNGAAVMKNVISELGD